MGISLRSSLSTRSRDYVLFELRRRLSDLPTYIKAVLLFGSIARGEANEYSDVDLLILHSDLPIIDLVERRRYLYRLIIERLGDVFDSITLIDMSLNEFLKPDVVTPLLLNIYVDAVVILDRVGEIEEFLSNVRRKVVEVGLKKVKDEKAYYWILPKPLEKVRIV
ncbi:MAG: nucleotidyltransferase domain-containing protein [Sulfolobales archaeon]